MDGVFFYKDWFPILRNLKSDKKALLLDMIIDYYNGLPVITDNLGDLTEIWLLIKDKIDKDLKAFKRRERLREIGRLGGLAKARNRALKNKDTNPQNIEKSTKTNKLLAIPLFDPNLLSETNSDEKEEDAIVKEDLKDFDIDLIIETMKEINGGIIDDKSSVQRKYGKLIKDKINKIKGFEKFRGNIGDFIFYLYQNCDTHKKPIFSSLEKFYFNLAGVIASVKKNFSQAQKNTIKEY